ncbi:MAG: endonuclease MutS2 [Oscillospiraceae bacterium]|nr:endonuclease MutS2 [Oscillospiraceae bacterium]
MNKHHIALELPKVLDRLASFTSCEDAKEAALNLEPESNLSLVNVLLQQTADAHMLMAKFGAPSFGGLKNVNNSLSRAGAGSVLNMRELLDIAEVLRVIRSLSEWKDRNSGIVTGIDTYFTSLVPNKFLEDRITSAIISEEEMSDNASPALYDIRRKIRAASSKVRDQLDKMTRSSHFQKFLRESIVTMRNGRYVVPVKAEHRGEISGLVHDTSSSGATVFIEPAGVVEANNEIKVLQSKERDEIDRILFELSAEAGGFYQSIKSSYECAVELNLIFAKAKLAYEMKASLPLVNDKGCINLKNARHPLIDPKKVVATNISLGRDFDTLVITGPNTGGKTVSIKTIGLMSLMAMCGLMLPVSDQSEISVFDRVLADIGDEQSIEQSLSTFSSHMVNIISIIEAADENTLVLIDELGAGTDPVEGAALAIAILEKIHEKGAKIAATTHYAELKAYALETPRIENGSCEFDVATLRPTYRLLIGTPGRSNAFAISLRLGMESGIIDRAKELVSQENAHFENVIESLESSRQSFEEQRARAQELTAQAEAEKREAQQYKDSIEKLRQQELEKAQSQALRIVEQARRSAMALTAELEKLKKESESARDKGEMARRAKQLMKKGFAEFDEITNPVVASAAADENYKLPRPLRPGDEVIVMDIGKAATVLSAADKKGNCEVMAGTMKLRTPQSNLRLTEKTKQTKKPRNVPNKNERVFSPGAEAQTRCDLRGMNVEEGILELDRYIDQCLRLGLGELTVIHGKGTGVLRKGIQEHLRKSSFVKSFRLGVYGEGENGVTIVTLK